MKKLTLEAESLRVESFEAGREEDEAGTVLGQVDCTHWNTCVCPSSRFRCADSPETLYSCDYTNTSACA